MDTRTGKIKELQDYIEEYDVDDEKDLPSHIVPIPTKEMLVMSNWGRKKRERYAELLKLNKSEEVAFDFVENHLGVIQDES